jgi:hypothetical protein
MEPIVSPWFIYAIGIADNLIEMLTGLGIVISAGLVVLAILFTFDSFDSGKKFWRIPVTVLALLTYWIIVNLIPSSKTLIGMAVASQITSERVVKAGKVVYAVKDDLKKDIIDIVLALKDKEIEKK